MLVSMPAYSRECKHPYKIDKTGQIYKFLTLSQSLLNDIRINPGLYKEDLLTYRRMGLDTGISTSSLRAFPYSEKCYGLIQIGFPDYFGELCPLFNKYHDT